jgi:hypothetical protein
MDILPIFGQQVIPDLQSPVDGSLVHPIIKVDAIKYVLLFRSQVRLNFFVETAIKGYRILIEYTQNFQNSLIRNSYSKSFLD